jgi:hypothetical protein
MHLTPAAIVAALNGDITNFLAAATPGGIEAQEAAGQSELVVSAMIPKAIHGATREQLTAIGFQFGADVDDLFVTCKLPAGWSKRATSHSMHSHLIDDKGRVRAGIYYKAAFYDRHASMSVDRRFSINQYSDGPDDSRATVILDGGAIIKTVGYVAKDNYKGMEPLYVEAVATLTATHPDYQNPLAYWD